LRQDWAFLSIPFAQKSSAMIIKCIVPFIVMFVVVFGCSIAAVRRGSKWWLVVTAISVSLIGQAILALLVE
jgi:hypothetical protein